jgi:hypothetical protein
LFNAWDMIQDRLGRVANSDILYRYLGPVA